MWREYVRRLKKSGYKGTCTLEIMGFNYYQNPQDAIMKSYKKVKELGILSS